MLNLNRLNSKQARDIISKCQNDPVFCGQEYFGIKTLTWDKHQEILRALRDNDRVTVRSGHSLGKDFLSGIISLWFLYSFKPAVVITTAPTERQVNKVIWGEISKYWRASRYPLGGELLSNEIKIADDWYAIGFTAKETNQTIGKFQGLKGRNVLVVVTEAQAVEDVIFDQIEGILTAENSKLYLAGNPLRTEGYFYRSFSDPTFKKFTMSCYDSPNYIQGKEIIPGLVGRKWVEDKEQRWGKDSPLFQARVLGEFPKQSINSLISVSSLEKSLTKTPVKGYKVLAIDPARFGDDSTCFADVTGGKLNAIEEYQGLATPEVEGKAISLIKQNDYDFVVVDEGAMGAGIYDHLQEAIIEINKERKRKSDRVLITEIIPFNFGSSPFDSAFADLGTDAYFWICDLIEKGSIQLIENQELFSQLSSRKYEFNLKGKMKLESKEKMKSRGMPSPDVGDAVVMGFWQAIEPDVNDFKTRDEQEEEDENFELQEVNDITGYPVRREREVFV